MRACVWHTKEQRRGGSESNFLSVLRGRKLSPTSTPKLLLHPHTAFRDELTCFFLSSPPPHPPLSHYTGMSPCVRTDKHRKWERVAPKDTTYVRRERREEKEEECTLCVLPAVRDARCVLCVRCVVCHALCMVCAMCICCTTLIIYILPFLLPQVLPLSTPQQRLCP